MSGSSRLVLPLEFRVLGPVELISTGRRVSLGGPKPRSVLAILLIVSGHVIPDSRIREMLWEDDEPTTASAQIRTYVYALRRCMEPGAKIVRQSQGYRIEVPADRVDLLEFERLSREGRRQFGNGDVESAADSLQAALGLWRGAALTGVTEPLARAEQPRLEEARLATLEDWIEACLTLGRHNELIPELTGLVSQYPLRERLRTQLMIALYRSGRQADALTAFHDARAVLASELGIDPSAELRRTHEAILMADTALDISAAPVKAIITTPPAAARPARHMHLPPDIADFSGRDKEVAQLLAVLRAGAEEPGAGAIPVISGMPGSGKTALAVRVAHACANDFPDGQLYLDLRGDQPNPQEPCAALGRLLRLLGVDGSGIEEDMAERIQLYHDLLAELRILVLLDNAADESQVRLLLPNNQECRVLVTSKARLTAFDGVQLFDLEVFDHQDALELLTSIVGSERVAADPRAAEQILRLCGHLPLAVRIAAARLAARAHWPLSRMARLLEDEHRCLDELKFADLEVSAGLMLGYRELPADVRRVFRLLGLLDTPSFGAWIAAALLDVDLYTAEELVEKLVDAHLLQVARVDDGDRYHYQFHSLVRMFAQERAASEEAEADRNGAIDRALSAWLALAEAADRRLPSQCFGVIGGGTARWDPGSGVVDAILGDPIAWFEAERAGLVSAVTLACDSDRVTQAWELAQALTNFFDLRSLYDDWRQTHKLVLAAARDAGNELGQAVMLRGLSERATFFNDHTACLSNAQQALALFERLGEGVGEVDALYYCASAYRQTGHPETAVACLERGIGRARQIGHRVGEAQLEESLGSVHTDQGRLEEALQCYTRSLDIWRELRKPRYEAIVMRSVGIAERDLGRFPAAALRFEECLMLFRDLGDRVGEAYTRNSLGDLCRKWGSRTRARAQYQQAMSLFTGIGLVHRFGHAIALRGLGELDLADGDLATAIGRLTQAVELWRKLDMPVWEARTLLGLGDAQAAHGQAKAAEETWRSALRLCERLRLPEAADLRWRLGAGIKPTS